MDKLDFPGVMLTHTAEVLVGWLIRRCVRTALEEAMAQG
jgi:hypothetical protein